MSLMNQYKSLLKKRPWPTRILSGLLVFMVLLILFRVLLPFAINIGTISWLESEGVKAKIFDTKISLWDGTIKIYGVSGENESGKGFSLEYLGVGWLWAPFFDRHVKIDQVEVRALYVDAKFFDDGAMNVAGLSIKPDTDESKTDSSEQLSENPWDATVQQIKLSDVGFCIQQFADTNKLTLDYCGKLAEFEWTGDASFKPSVQSEASEILPVYAQGVLKLNNIELLNKQLNLSLLNVDSVVVNNINVDTLENIRIDNIGVEQFSTMQRANKKSARDAQIFAFNRLNIQPVSFSQQNDLHLGKIELTDAQSFVNVNKNGHMEFEQWIPVSQKQEPAAKSTGLPDGKLPDGKKATTPTATESFNFAFDELIFKSKQHFIYVDNSLKEPFVSDIHNIDFKLTGLDSKAPEKMSHALLALAIDKHGSFKMEADISPLSERPNIKGVGEISGADLRSITPYSRQYVGHNVKSGQLDADLKINVEKGVIDSNLGLVLHHFELKSLSKKEAEELNSEFGFPLSTSLSLLRDKDNAIRLEIPISGDIENPDFDPRDAIVKASSKAITTAVLHYYTPFGLIFAAEGLFSLATALNFAPVLFDAGDIKLTSTHKEQLDKLASLMVDRPGIHLTLCGFSNLADKNKLFPKHAKAVAAATTPEKLAKVKPLSKENIAALLKLSESRSSNVKNYLVNDKATKASRLIECAPEHVDEKISGVEISI